MFEQSEETVTERRFHGERITGEVGITERPIDPLPEAVPTFEGPLYDGN